MNKYDVKTAILVDGGFYRRRAYYYCGEKSPEERAEELYAYCMKLLHDKSDLTDADLKLNIEQKGVDMRIGIDIASLAYKKLVNQIILISGDSDFVPAAKQARREGIDFILAPMGATIKADLFEHIDGLKNMTMQVEAVKTEE